MIDPDIEEFNELFFTFRYKVRQFDKRLASIMIQGLSDCSTLNSKFKLLETFENLLDRTIIITSLENEFNKLLIEFKGDLRNTSYLFNSNKNSPIIPRNFPAVSGACFWANGLLERIRFSMNSLSNFNSLAISQNNNEMNDIVKDYTTLVSQMEDYKHEVITNWTKSLEDALRDRLKKPLLRYGNGLIVVNFDIVIAQILKETNYLLQFNINMPQVVIEIYKKSEFLRVHFSNLELVVQGYNTLLLHTIDVERPLIQVIF